VQENLKRFSAERTSRKRLVRVRWLQLKRAYLPGLKDQTRANTMQRQWTLLASMYGEITHASPGLSLSSGYVNASEIAAVYPRFEKE